MFFRRKRTPQEDEGRGGSPQDPGSRGAPGTGPGTGALGAADGGGGEAGLSTQFLTGDSGVDRRTVQILLEAIRRVSEARNLEELLVDIVDRSIELTGAERGLLLLEGQGQSLLVRVARSRDGKRLEDDARFSTSIAQKVFRELQPVRATVSSDSEALELGRSVYDLKLRAVMCVPLTRRAPEAPAAPGARGRAAESDSSAQRAEGVLYVDSRAATRQFTKRDLGLFAALAQHISIALLNARLHLDSVEKVRLEQNMQLASAIQRDLMPSAVHRLEGFETAGWYRAAEGTAGDFYDVVKAKGGRLGVLLGDVTGHGIGPALITASAQAAVRSTLRLVDDAGEAVTLLNQDLCERVEEGRFLTLYLAVVSPDGSMQLVGAGHPPALLWRAAKGHVETLPASGPALGMIDDEIYQSDRGIRLEPGDALLLYSDGVIEARPANAPEDFLGQAGLEALFARVLAKGPSAADAVLELAEAVLARTGDTAEDDITFVLLRRMAP